MARKITETDIAGLTKGKAALVRDALQAGHTVTTDTGVIWFKVHVRGLPVHVREAGAGANAIEASFEIMRALRGLEAEWNRRQKNHRYFEDYNHPINLNFGKIAGGDWASSVPAWCSFDCRISIYPGVDPREGVRL